MKAIEDKKSDASQMAARPINRIVLSTCVYPVRYRTDEGWMARRRKSRKKGALNGESERCAQESALVLMRNGGGTHALPPIVSAPLTGWNIRPMTDSGIPPLAAGRHAVL